MAILSYVRPSMHTPCINSAPVTDTSRLIEASDDGYEMASRDTISLILFSTLRQNMRPYVVQLK